MKTNKCFLLFFLLISLYKLSAQQDNEVKKYFLMTKAGKSMYAADRIRFYSDDKLLVLDKKQSTISLFSEDGKSYPVIDKLFSPIDFDYSNGSLFLLDGESKLKKYYLSSGNMEGDKTIKVDSVVVVTQQFKKPASVTADKLNRYVVVADTGSINSINSENKMFSLKFLNYRPGDIAFDSYSRSVYSAEGTTKSLVKISADGKLEQLISNYDSNNPFVVDERGDVIILDIKNNTVIRLNSNLKLSIIITKILGAKSITMSRNCDSIFYIANMQNEFYRIEEIPDAGYKTKNIFSAGLKSKIFKSDSSFIVFDRNKMIHYSLSGKKLSEFTGNKKELDNLAALSCMVRTAGDSLLVDSRGKLIRIKTSGERVVNATGLNGFSKILFSTDSCSYVLSGDGILLRVDLKGGKTFLSRKISLKSEIISATDDEVILKDGAKVYKLVK